MIPAAIVIFFAIGLHEYAHCKFADMAGDPTPRLYGRVTLDLTKHFELMGTIMILITSMTGVGIGWGKPAPMDPNRMRNPRWDFFMAVIAGPISNIVQAVVWALFARILLATGTIDVTFLSGINDKEFLPLLIYFGVMINLSLAFFNLFPLGPLDGHWLLGLLMPDRARDKWFLWNKHYGWYALIAVVIIGQLTNFRLIWMIMGPGIDFMSELLLKPFLVQ